VYVTGGLGRDKVSRGVLYVAHGQPAIDEAGRSIESLKRYHPDWPVLVVGEKSIQGAKFIRMADHNFGAPGRWAKVRLDRFSPFDDTLFLDADTRVYAKLDLGFDILDAGWDMVMVPSIPQAEEKLGHLCERERYETLNRTIDPLQLNTGVIWFRKSERVKSLFDEWRKQWERYKDKDQGAFLRALEVRPVKLWLLGRPFNGGSVVGHRFGACRVR
jgi:hypothetical protein